MAFRKFAMWTCEHRVPGFDAMSDANFAVRAVEHRVEPVMPEA